MTTNPYLIAYLATILLISAGVFAWLGESQLAAALVGASVGLASGVQIQKGRTAPVPTEI